jgi:hypothetical protein
MMIPSALLLSTPVHRRGVTKLKDCEKFPDEVWEKACSHKGYEKPL